MCHSSHTDFFSKDLPTSNNTNGENNKTIVSKRRKTELKRETLLRAIIDNFYKRKIL